ncbi:MAG: 50S ribosomal protein L1 [Deltaproteobacteria bacterium]|nr:50S ribosomal protein L1 [Deltaproteobacteria bacterium]
MKKRGKKYQKARAQVDRNKRYSLDEAISLMKKIKYTKFDETADASFRLNVDPKNADQNIKGSVLLPHGLGKQFRVLVFAKGDKEKEALNAGADYVGGEDLVKKIQDGWFEFDKVIATPDMMGVIKNIGKLLGPKGLMPNPKLGTVTMDIAKAVKDAKAGKADFKVDKQSIIHTSFGKLSFEDSKLKENFLAIFEAIVKMRPPSVKGQYIKSVAISSTMGPGFKLDLSQLMNAISK